MESYIEFAVGTFNAPTTGATIDFTIPDFGTPKLVEFFISGADTLEASVATGRIGTGVTDGVSQWAWGVTNVDGVASPGKSYRVSLTDACVVLGNVAGTSVDLRLSFNSWITDGVRLNVQNPADSAYVIHGVLTKGTGVQVAVGTLIAPDSAVELEVTGVGFTPDILKFGSIGRGLGADTSTHATSMGICVNDGSLTQGCILRDVTTPTSIAIISSSTVYGQLTPSSGTILHQGIVTAVGPDGFTVTGSVGPAASDLAHWVAVNIGIAKCSLSIYAKPTTTGLSTIVDAGWTPAFVGLLTCDLTAIDTIDTTANAAAIGVSLFTESTAGSLAMFAKDAVSPSVVDSLASGNAIVSLLEEGAVADAAVVDSMSRDGAVVNFTTASATPRLWLVLSVSRVDTVGYEVELNSCTTTAKVFKWQGVSELSLLQPIKVEGATSISVMVEGEFGTGGVAGIEGSNAVSGNFYPLATLSTFSSSGIAPITEIPLMIKPVISAGDDVFLDFYVFVQ